MYADLKVLDPVFSTDSMTRNYGYMVYDTLFGIDDSFTVQPQMVDSYTVSDDRMSYSFMLREGLAFHDGAAVTAEDVVASLRRWGERDSLGKMLMAATRELKAVDGRTFTLELAEPFGMVLEALGKPGSNVPFIMPARIAATPSNEQITEYVGSGPFVFQEDEWKPGSLAVLTKNEAYVPRAEPASWLAGGKEVRIDRLELVTMPDNQTAVNALIAGEIDFFENPSYDLLPLLEAETDTIEIAPINDLGGQLILRMNHLQPPFDNPKMREAVLAAISQEEFLKASIGDPRYYRVCAAMFMCDTPFASDAGTEAVLGGDTERARQLLAEAGYDGSEIVILQPTSVPLLINLAPVARKQLELAGFKVRIDSMDWKTFISRRGVKEPVSEGGWNIFMTAFPSVETTNPAIARGFEASCETAYFGWPCDPDLEALRTAFVQTDDPAAKAEIATRMQLRGIEIGVYGNLGEYVVPAAWRKDRLEGMLKSPAIVFWNVSKAE